MKRDFKSNLDSSENNDNHEDENTAGAKEHLNNKITEWFYLLKDYFQ